jgi:hypothetical protein
MAPDPAHGLDEALRVMTFRVRPETFALLAFPRARAAEALALAARAPVEAPASVVLEADVATVFAPEDVLLTSPALDGARVERGQRLVTFEAPMAWDVVGFLALVTRALADVKVPVGAVCGFDRDHVFVHGRFLDAARAALRERVCPEAAG